MFDICCRLNGQEFEKQLDECSLIELSSLFAPLDPSFLHFFVEGTSMEIHTDAELESAFVTHARQGILHLEVQLTASDPSFNLAFQFLNSS